MGLRGTDGFYKVTDVQAARTATWYDFLSIVEVNCQIEINIENRKKNK